MHLRLFISLLLGLGLTAPAFAQIDHWEIAASSRTHRHENLERRGGQGAWEGEADLAQEATELVTLHFKITDTFTIAQAMLKIRGNGSLLRASLNGIEVFREGAEADAALQARLGQAPPIQDEVFQYPGGQSGRYFLDPTKIKLGLPPRINVLCVLLRNENTQPIPQNSSIWLQFGMSQTHRLFGQGRPQALTPITSSNLPLVFIDTHGQVIDDVAKIVADMGIVANPGGARNYVTDPYNDYNGRIAIEVRGSTSQQYPKKSYGFETQTATGANNNVSLIGLPSENDWILYAPYPDKTLLRNTLAYHLFGQMRHYTPGRASSS
jgi:CotH kinase protein